MALDLPSYERLITSLRGYLGELLGDDFKSLTINKLGVSVRRGNGFGSHNFVIGNTLGAVVDQLNNEDRAEAEKLATIGVVRYGDTQRVVEANRHTGMRFGLDGAQAIRNGRLLA